MATAPHRIRRQSWRIRARTAADAFRLRGEVRAAWEDVLLPALEQAFDQAVPADRVVRIPRLELHLRLGSPEELVDELPRLIREAVGDQLGGVGRARTAGARSLGAAESRAEALVHYLRTGALPWPLAGRPREEVMEELRAAAVAEWDAIVPLLPAAPAPDAFAFRLLQLLEERVAAEHVAALPPGGSSPAVRAALAALLHPARPGGGPAAPRHARLEAAARILARVLAGTAEDDGLLLREVSSAAPPAVRETIARLLALDAPGAGESRREPGSPPEAKRPRVRRPPRAPGPDEAAAGAAAEGRAPEEPRAGAKSRRPAPVEQRGGRPAVPGVEGPGEPRWAAAVEPEEGRAPRSDEPAADEEFDSAVASAGLVLLHPFLPMLLQETGLSRGGAMPWESLPRAAALLHYLATGSEEPLEFELGTVKLLLGLDPATPLPVAEGLLSGADRAEADALLVAAIGHWSVLKSTSPDGLRGSFLRRPGLLRREDESWLLRVEPAAFDLLLAHLPWSIAIVRMPWMPDPVYIEWPTS